VAAAIVMGDCGFAQVCEDGLRDPDVLDMLSKLQFVKDDEIEALFPAQRLCRIEIELQDGTKFLSDRYRPDGEACDNVDMEWVERKFRRITACMLTEEQQTEILSLLQGDLDTPVYDIVQKINRIMIPVRNKIL
jgi:2-methylcitrate dehydratase PrpD